MELYIRAKSTEPVLKMKFIGDSDETVKEFYERVQRSSITFSMKDTNGVYKIFKKKCGLITKQTTSDLNDLSYQIYYKWETEDTDTAGTYEGIFEINFFNAENELESTLIAPIRERLYVTIIT